MNVITNDNNNDLIGFYTDIKAYLCSETTKAVNGGDYEQAEEMCGILNDLERYKNEGRLLVISDNNGFGYTIDIYGRK